MKKIITSSLVILLFGALITSSFLGTQEPDPILNGLTEVHNKLIQTEVELSKVKVECEKLEALRDDRDSLTGEVNNIINTDFR